tara:strand:- start:119 stop:646 length:528 start_codon:yes stop_codon:yes gene_type:complete
VTYDLLLRNRGVSRVIVGVPEGEVSSIRARLETGNGDVITLAEATLSALVQAYMDVFTHPSRQAIELCSEPAGSGEPDQIAPRLVEGATEEEALRRELAAGPSGHSLMDDADDDETTSIQRSEVPKGEKDFSSPLSIDDGPVFGDVATQHSTPAPIDADSSIEEPGPGSGNDDNL